MNLLGAAALGLVLGIVTGMPLGVINIAIVDAATSGHARTAVGIALGGAAADTVHAALAFAGVAHLLTAQPDWVRAMAIIAGVVIALYVVIAWRTRGKTAESIEDRGIARGILAGIAMTLPNPAVLAAWVAVASATWPHASTITAVVIASGVGIGSALWLVMLARWVAAAHGVHRVLRIVPRVALVVLLAIAVAGVIRVL